MSSSAAETSHQKYCYYDYLMRINGFSDGEVKQKLSDDEYQYYQTFLNQKQETEEKEKEKEKEIEKEKQQKKKRRRWKKGKRKTTKRKRRKIKKTRRRKKN